MTFCKSWLGQAAQKSFTTRTLARSERVQSAAAALQVEPSHASPAPAALRACRRESTGFAVMQTPFFKSCRYDITTAWKRGPVRDLTILLGAVPGLPYREDGSGKNASN